MSGIPAFVVSHVSCCFLSYTEGNDSTGDQPCEHRLKYFGKELSLAAPVLYTEVVFALGRDMALGA